MYKNILAFLVIIVSLVNGQCARNDGFCFKANEFCNSSSIGICPSGYYCGPNPAIPAASEAVLGAQGSSFEPIPANICLKFGGVGDNCVLSSATQNTLFRCDQSLTCYNPPNVNQYPFYSTCQQKAFKTWGESCNANYQCIANLKCDPLSDTCVADLTSTDIRNQKQCNFNSQCDYNSYCASSTTGNYLCIPRVQVGATCGFNNTLGYTIQCENQLSCIANSNGNRTCVAPFSLNTVGANCGSQDLSGYNANYLSLCDVGMGLYCNFSSVCDSIPTPTSSSSNCTAFTGSQTCNAMESCTCLNGTSNGVCTGIFDTSSTVMSSCKKLSLELIQCQVEHQCVTGNYVPDSCTMTHCRGNFCNIQSKCTYVPQTNLVCPGDSVAYGYCSLSGSSTIYVPAMTMFIMVILAIIF